MEQVLMEKYGEEWEKKLTEIVSEIIEKELLNHGYIIAHPLLRDLMREYDRVVYKAAYMIEYSEPYTKIILGEGR